MGNPFVVGRGGTRSECMHLFTMLLGGLIAVTAKAEIADQRKFLCHAEANIGALRGRNLACWCPLDAECHADVLLRIANKDLAE